MRFHLITLANYISQSCNETYGDVNSSEIDNIDFYISEVWNFWKNILKKWYYKNILTNFNETRNLLYNVECCGICQILYGYIQSR